MCLADFGREFKCLSFSLSVSEKWYTEAGCCSGLSSGRSAKAHCN